MNILSPLSNSEETKPLIEAGADEFYAGVLMEKWESKYGIGNLNRRAVHYANFSGLDELKKALDISHDHGVPVFLVLNNMGYTPDQMAILMDIVQQASSIGIDAFVVSDIGLLSEIKNQIPDATIHISTIGATFNSSAANFYKELGASRIVLDRQLSLNEIETIVRNVPDVGFEVFVFNWKGMYIEGLCTVIPSFNNFYDEKQSKKSILKTIRSLLKVDVSKFRLDSDKLPDFALKLIGKFAHLTNFINMEPCCFLYDVSDIPCNSTSEKDRKNAVRHVQSCFHDTFITKARQPDCGLCSIYELSKIGIKSIKMEGRSLPFEKKVKDIKLIKKVVQYVQESGAGENDIKMNIKKIFTKEYQLKKCDPKGCYYNSNLSLTL